MDKDLVRRSIIFRGMTEEELDAALVSLKADAKHYGKDEVLLHAGDCTDRLGLVLSGSVRIENNDIWGNRTILSHVAPGQVFAETYALLQKEPLLVDAVANQDSTVLMLNVSGIKSLANIGNRGIRTAGIRQESRAVDARQEIRETGSRHEVRAAGARQAPVSSWMLKLLTNLLTVSTQKNLMLSGRSFHTSPKSIRGKVMAYLSTVSLQEGSDEFDIPFDRQQLADYLNVDRTALSKELGKMTRDGIIKVRKSHFRLII